MKYWEMFFLTVGAGCLVGAVIAPGSWLGVPISVVSTFVGWYLHKKGGAA